MNPTLTIRAARLSDAEAIAALTRQLGYYAEPSVVASRVARLLERSDQQLLVADDGGRAVGWIHMVLSECVDADSFVVIAGLVVDRNYRKQGIGRRLLEHAEAWTVQHGCSVVRLTSSATRVEAHAFYRRVGYSNIKTQYSFAKPVGTAGPETLRAFVPDVT